MPRQDDIQHSALIVSASDPFIAGVRGSLKGFLMQDVRKSAAAARRCVLERYYDLVVIGAPLPDETGERFAADVTQQCGASVLLAVPAEACEAVRDRVTDHGVLVLPRPLQRGQLDMALRYLISVQDRLHRMEKRVRAAEEKTEEIRIVDRAKFLLVEKKHMTEADAHRLIGKRAMDSSISRKRIAEGIIEDLE